LGFAASTIVFFFVVFVLERNASIPVPKRRITPITVIISVILLLPDPLLFSGTKGRFATLPGIGCSFSAAGSVMGTSSTGSPIGAMFFVGMIHLVEKLIPLFAQQTVLALLESRAVELNSSVGTFSWG
jgi:hypothetical protein